MNTALKKVPAAPAASQSGRDLMEVLRSRQSQEMVIAFAGPIGSSIQSVMTKTKSILNELGYTRVKVIKLSKFLNEALTSNYVDALEIPANKSEPYAHYRKLQHAGNALRERTGNMSVLAEYAVKEIVLDRRVNKPDQHADPSRVAYLIDQVKRPEEVEFLRTMYRNLFYLVAVTKPHAQRRSALEEKGLEESEIDDLMEIDRNESEEGGGQRLEKTLHLADFFIRNDSNLDQTAPIRRFSRLIHGDKSLTPNRVETGMYAAYAAGLRSACLSRQVGAAILSSGGEVLATGCNDVPESGGGLYSANSTHDYRCVHRPNRTCFNDREKRKLQTSIGEQLLPALKELGIDSVPDGWLAKVMKGVSEKTRLGSLIEFSRSVHAEMDAIVSLARRGGPGISNATLYTTTFPCHSCARHIVAAGITSVFYIEPYEKSMAQMLHKDAINFDEPQQQAGTQIATKVEVAGEDLDDEPLDGYQHERVKFVHFEGVAPRLFAAVFRADNRKEKTSGRFIEMLEVSSQKVLPEYLDDYRKVETAAVAHFDDLFKSLSDTPSLTQQQ